MMRESYANRQQNPPVLENMEIVVALVLMAVCWFSWYVAHERYNLTNRQIAEVACYLALGGLAIAGSAILIATARSRREKRGPIHRWLSPANGTSSLRPKPGSKTPWSSATTSTASLGTGRTESASCRASCWA